MEWLDWRLLSGPYVSRRTMLRIAAASGAAAFAGRMAAVAARAAATPTRTLQDGGKTGGTLRLGYGISQVLSLDPAQVNLGIVAGELLPNLFSSLVQFDTDLGLVPDLAEHWEVSEDGLQYTFFLRDGLTFHNGDPLRANDVIYTYERTTNPNFASPHANKLRQVSSIEAPDDLTVAITLSDPFAPFLAAACSRGPGRALTPVPRRAIEEMGDEQYGVTPVGSGPFRIVPEGANLSNGFELVPFEDWYAGRPFLDSIEVTLIAEASSMVSALEVGDADMLDIVPAIGVAQLRDNPDVTLVESPGTNWIGLAMNWERPPWNNPEARMAVAKAIDRDDLVEKAWFGNAVPGIGPIAPAFGWVYQDPDQVENPQAFNLDEATALAESTGIVGAQPILMVTVDNPRPAEVLRNQLNDLGLDVQIDLLQHAAWNERWLVSDFDWIINGSVVDADPDDGHWNFFYSEGPWNTFKYHSERADELLVATRSTGDQDDRAELFQELQALLQKDVAYAFLYHTLDVTGFRSDVKGYVAIPEMRYLESVWLDR